MKHTYGEFESKLEALETKYVINSMYVHLKTGDVYYIIGFVFDTDIDKFKIMYRKRKQAVNFSRSVDEFDEKFLKINMEQ
jgi:hypothetical protein